MQPRLVDQPPAGEGWLHEIKYDGYRCQLHIDGSQITTYTRNGHDWTHKFGPIAKAARAIPARQAIIDGEICVQDERGVTDFSALQSAIKSRPQDLVFFAFDLLHLNGGDLRPAPLEERRAKLRLLISQVPGSRIVMSDEYDGDGAAFFDLVSDLDLEGMVSKRKGSRYWSGSSEAWRKTKCWAVSTMAVIGVERDKAGVPYALLANERGYQGAAFVGLPVGLRREFWRYVEGKAAAVAPIVGLKKSATWLQPGMTAKVRYLKGSDKMRHAVVQGVDFQA
ncbi:ATP-dependent DNA ligase [Devosia submarina]|uniref:ATP-dependent DNA ligase n=1 Tax=Devosia submarina TaxID=1173082 RepID=UPI001FE65865|nr:ATP-dependent DNA ligase [Devosia submarina]